MPLDPLIAFGLAMLGWTALIAYSFHGAARDRRALLTPAKNRHH